ncbi:MAG: hypothetical protein HETSPECPRED_009278 [Heterodermia speciosa]|uniref:Uncharacterized protein n=1 Tax=Heterodermia speciosa TaxID=116794 RepID=A0A8H3G1N1_9LECA|nr:MAG: hypothetical protein HETSPECPRED_009278 [Heterodermia speciosa]
MSNSCDNSSANVPSPPNIHYSQLKQKLQQQIVDLCTLRDGADDSTLSSPAIDYSQYSQFKRTIQMPVVEKQSAIDQRPRCCFEGFAVNRARYFLQGVLEARRFDQRRGEKEDLQSLFADIPEERPIHAEDIFKDALDIWFNKGILQGTIDKEAGILPGENEKLDLLFQVDPELLVLWLENHITLKKKHRANCDEPSSKKELPDHQKHSDPDGKLSEDPDRDSVISKGDDAYDENSLSMNELYQLGQLRYLESHLNEHHPDTSESDFNIAIAEARVRGEFKRIKTALGYLQKGKGQTNKIRSFNRHTREFAELAVKFLKHTVEMYADAGEASEQISAAFFKEFSSLYPKPEECKGRDGEEIEFQKQFVVAMGKSLGSILSEQDDE